MRLYRHHDPKPLASVCVDRQVKCVRVLQAAYPDRAVTGRLGGPCCHLRSPEIAVMSTRHGIASLAVFVCALTVYLANGRTLRTGDTLPARYLPFSILREHDFDLDEFPFLYDAAARRNTPLL